MAPYSGRSPTFTVSHKFQMRGSETPVSAKPVTVAAQIAHISVNCASVMHADSYDTFDTVFPNQFQDQAVTDPDFDALLTDLLADTPQHAQQSASGDLSTGLAMPWTPLLPYGETQLADDTPFLQIPAPLRQLSSTDPSSSQGTSDSQVPKHSAQGTRLAPTSSKAAKGSSKRSEAWILKNRRAQQKFRAKEKEHKAQLNEQLQEMTKQMEALQAQQAELQGRNATLKKICDSQQQQVNLLITGQDESVTSCDPAIEEEPTFLQENTVAKRIANFAGQQNIANAAAVEAVSTTDVQTAWTQLAANMSQILDRLKVDNSNLELYGQLRQCTTLAGVFTKQTILGDPDNIRKIYSVDWDDRPGNTDLQYRTRDHWQSITDTLELSLEQKAAVVLLVRRFRQQKQELQARQQWLHQSMVQTTEEDILAAGVATMSFQTDQQRLQDLSSTLRAETGLWLELYNNVFANVFTPLQYGRAVASSGPHNVDAMAIAACVDDELEARGLTELNALEQLAAAAPAYREQALLLCR